MVLSFLIVDYDIPREEPQASKRASKQRETLMPPPLDMSASSPSFSLFLSLPLSVVVVLCIARDLPIFIRPLEAS